LALHPIVTFNLKHFSNPNRMQKFKPSSAQPSQQEIAAKGTL
jgi:hypothetical protein